MANDDTFWIDPTLQPLLTRVGWDRFDAVMDATAGHCLRRMSDRENWRFDLTANDGGPIRLYLKKHRSGGFIAQLRAKLRLSPPPTAARQEMENVLRLREVGIGSVRVVAMGERFFPDGRAESFLLTQDLSGFVELPAFLPAAVPSRPKVITRGRRRELDPLIAGVAEIARKLHRGGYNHRDLYAGHFFVGQSDSGNLDIRLIDLQRVQHRRWFRCRWLVKDLAQLAWSLPTDHVGCRDRMAFMRSYLGVTRLTPHDKRLLREIIARQERMQRKLGRAEEHGMGC